MKKKMLILLLILSLLGISMRSGALGRIYGQITGNSTEFSLKVKDRYDPARDLLYSYGGSGCFPSFQVTKVGNKTVTVASGSGRAANVTTPEKEKAMGPHRNDIYCIAKGYGDSVFWWQLDGGYTYSVYVKTSRYGIVLKQKKIVLTKNLLYGYDARVENGWDPFDVPLFLCIVLFLTGIYLLVLLRRQHRKA